MENFCSFILRVSTLQILQTTGFEKSSSIGADVLTDVFGKYLELLGTIAQKNATHAGRTRANAYDVGATFEKLGIKFNELEEWLQNEKDSKAYGSWEGEDPSEVLKDLLGGSPQGSTDDQYLVFGESSSRVNLDDEFHLFGEVTEEDSEEERHTKRKRQYGFSVSNYHSKNELGKKESHLNQFQDFPLDETASLQNSDLAEDKINNQVWWGQFMPSYVPEHLPPFPDLYFRQKLKDEQITPSSQLIEDNQKTNNGVLDLFRALDLKEHKADEVKDIFDENVQLGLPNIQDSDDREDNLLIQKNSPRTTSDTLKLPSSESFENAFKSFAPKKFPISITDKPKKRRRVGKSPFVIPIVETVSSTSQHPLYSESWTESIPESVPKELHLPKIEVTKPTSTLNPDTQPEELIDVAHKMIQMHHFRRYYHRHFQ
ncbi:hypothetical protein G9A89_005258 [Geosiphon pyriformis]|nr:hypothetical protein G9A89_005258 [Geosiphon pyriformis]